MAAPVVRVEAMVVASRKWVSRRRWSGVEPVFTVTFEDPSGERLELPVRGQAVVEGLTEGVPGLLTFQGTRFQGFVRHDAVDGQR